MTTYVSTGDLFRHVATGHDVLLMIADTEPDNIVATHCNEPGCEWAANHLVVDRDYEPHNYDLDSLHDGRLLYTAANLLYQSDDPRASQWPDPQTLGYIRSRLRGLADGYDHTTRGGRP